MKELSALNVFFWKYRVRFFIGIVFVIATNYLAVLAPQITGYVVGLVQAQAEYPLDEFEVADVFEVPLRFLMDPANHQVRVWQSEQGGRRFYAMPYENRFIWGATAGMLRNLYHLLKV